jgi:hypothetical protein
MLGGLKFFLNLLGPSFGRIYKTHPILEFFLISKYSNMVSKI